MEIERLTLRVAELESLLREYLSEHVCHCSQHDLERVCLWCRVDKAINGGGV